MYFLQTYPYLISSLLLLLIFSMGLAFSHQGYRRSVLLSALISAPTSLASFIFVPDYWNPKRLVSFEIGPEDIIFSFATGGISWMMVLVFLRGNVRLEFNWRIILKRYAGFMLFGNMIYFLWLFTGINIMIATVITICMIGLWILLQRKNLWLICIVGASGFVVFYILCLKAVFILFPDFPYQWNIENLFGFFIFGIPLEEVIWGVACGAVWPLIISYLLNAQFISNSTDNITELY